VGAGLEEKRAVRAARAGAIAVLFAKNGTLAGGEKGRLVETARGHVQ
jgi:hypothetical protein